MPTLDLDFEGEVKNERIVVCVWLVIFEENLERLLDEVEVGKLLWFTEELEQLVKQSDSVLDEVEAM